MPAPQFEDYRTKYEYIKLDRSDDGILLVTLHENGGEITWGFGPHSEVGYMVEDIGRDPENKVIIITASGNSFIEKENLGGVQATPDGWIAVHHAAKRLTMGLIDIEQPMIAAINGPAAVHAEIGVLCDIVLAADHAYFSDAPHFSNGLVPGDGVQVVWPMLLGLNRGRHFLLTGRKIYAAEALALGLVAEVMPADQLVARAYELAREILKQPPTVVRWARPMMVHAVKKALLDSLGYGLQTEGLSWVAYPPPK